MNTNKIDILVALGVGVVAGVVVSSFGFASKYNSLVGKYNMLAERDGIKSRVFEEMYPELPDDFQFSDNLVVDMKSWTLFADNDL